MKRTKSPPKPPRRILKVSQAASVAFGSDDLSARRKIIRLCDDGSLRHIRLGARRDRHIFSHEIERIFGVDEHQATDD